MLEISSSMSLAVGIVLSFTAAFAWGSSLVIFKVGVKNTDPLNATYIKGLIAIPLLIIIALISVGPSSLAQLFHPPTYYWLIGAVITITLGDFFSLFALKKIYVSISQPITAIYPLVTNLILLFTGKELITWLIIVGTIIIATGVIIVSYFSQKDEEDIPDKNKEEEDELSKEEKAEKRKTMMVGIILSLLAALFWGINIFFSKLILDDPQVDVVSMMAIRNGLMVVMAFVFALSRAIGKRKEKGFEIFAPKKDALLLSVGGALAWCVGGMSFFTAVRKIGAGISTPLSSISPLVVLFLGVFLLKEKMTKKQLIGILFIFAGSLLLSLKDVIL